MYPQPMEAYELFGYEIVICQYTYVYIYTHITDIDVTLWICIPEITALNPDCVIRFLNEIFLFSRLASSDPCHT
jgi:hypothetical protein